MTQDLITQADLEWWLSRAAELEWTFAKTYAETAPHHYVVENRTPGVTHEDTVRAARVIHTFGQPGKYYSLTKIYLVSPDGRYRWWTEDRHFTDTTLVNRATTELFYGIQNAQATISGIETPFDGIATWWDAEHPVADGEPDRVKRLSLAFGAPTLRRCWTSAVALGACWISDSSRPSAMPGSTPARQCSTCCSASTRRPRPCTPSTCGRLSARALSRPASSTGSSSTPPWS